MKRSFLLISLIISVAFLGGCRKSGGEKDVSSAIDSFYAKGMVNADKDFLENILHKDLIYGHSSGYFQNKAELINEVVSLQPLDYITADISGQTIKMSGNLAIVHHIFSSVTSSNGKPGNIHIGIMMVWTKQQGKWKLLARQGFKL
jgi:hypothetical protein